MTSRQSQGVFSVKNINFPYIRKGSGMPILVIGSAAYYSRAFSGNLIEHFELIFVDLRHFIPSYNPKKEDLEKITLETFVDDVESIRELLGLNKMSILGHSMNAQIALRCAEKYPKHTSHLVLVCGVPYMFSEFSKEVNEFWVKNASKKRKAIFLRNLEQLEASFASIPPARSFEVMYLANGPKVWRDPSYNAKWLVEGVESSVGFSHLTSILPSRTEVRKSLENLQMPVLVITGRHDYAIPHFIWEDMVADLDNVTYHLLDKSSHNPQTENSDIFDKLLITWFAKH